MTKAKQIKDMLERGCKYPEIMREVGCAGSTIAYHAKKIGMRKYTFERVLYDWDAIQKYYDEGYTFKDISCKFGVEASTIAAARDTGKLIIESDETKRREILAVRRTQKQKNGERVSNILWTIEDLSTNSRMSQTSLKRILKTSDLLPQYCAIEACSLHGIINPIWAGSPIVLHLDHINGISNDNRIENLRWLCPNCHSQTSTYCGRNKG